MLYYMVYVEVLLYLATQSCTSWVNVSGHRMSLDALQCTLFIGREWVVPPYHEPEGREKAVHCDC